MNALVFNVWLPKGKKKKKRKRKRMGNKGDVSPFIPLEVTSQGVGVCVYNGKR